MRQDGAIFEIENKSASKEPHYVVEIAFDASATDLWYFTTHADTGDLTKNLLLQTNNFNASDWVKHNVEVSTQVSTGIGSAILDRVVVASAVIDPYLYQDVSARTVLAGNTFTFSIQALTNVSEPKSFGLTLQDNASSEVYSSTFTLNTSTTEGINITATFASASSEVIRARVDLVEGSTANIGDYIFLHAAQLNEGTYSGTYFEVSSKQELVPTETYESTVLKISGTSQSLDSLRSTSTIGNMSIHLLDKDGDITSLINAKLELGYGLRGKRVRVWSGYNGYDFGQYTLIQTQIIDSMSFLDNVYTLRLADIQREQRKDIFNLALTGLAGTVNASSSTVTVFDTSDFQMMEHSNGFSDHPNETVGYFKLEDEVICYSSQDATHFYVASGGRGALNTRAAEHIYESGQGEDDQLEIEEFVYLELPAKKLAYALLTGKLLNQSSAVLPTEWHMGISSSYVDATDFTTRYPDLWDGSSDDTNGIIFRFAGLDSQDGKKFLETEIYQALGCYSPINTTGAIGLRRMANILQGAPYSEVLNDSNIVRLSNINHGMRDLRNKYQIKWNYDFLNEKFTRTNLLFDTQSIGKHGDVPTYKLEFKGLHGSRHSFNTVHRLFDSLRDRYAGPPVVTNARLLPSMNTIEVGDVVRVQTSTQRDFVTGKTLDRSFEVQNVKINWINGDVDVQLLGSSEPATSYDLNGDTFVLTSAFYTSEGTDLRSYGSAYFSTVGGVVHLTQDLTLIGASTVTQASSIFYINDDFTIDAGVTLSIEENIQLRTQGFFTINGNVNGSATGVSAGASSAGGFGYTRSGGGIDVSFGRPPGPSIYETFLNATGGRTHSAETVMPIYNLEYDGSATISGFPNDLRGVAGATGNRIYVRNMSLFVTHPIGVRAVGGIGGDSGAGFMPVCRGMGFGISGNINLNGANGTGGSSYQVPEDATLPSILHMPIIYSGTGGGGAGGALFVVLDGADVTRPSISSTTFTSEVGDSPIIASALMSAPFLSIQAQQEEFTLGSYYRGLTQGVSKIYGVQHILAYSSAAPSLLEGEIRAPSSVTVETGTSHLYVNDDGTVYPRIFVHWDPTNDQRVVGYEIQYAYTSTIPTWYDIPPVLEQQSSSAYVVPVQTSALYDIRIRSATGDRRQSEWVSVASTLVIGKNAAPSDVTGFSNAYGHDTTFLLTWNAITDLDASSYEIRYGGSDWDTATFLVNITATEYSTLVDFTGSRTYRIKAIDTSGNYSTNAATTIVTVTPGTITAITTEIVDGSIIRLNWTGNPGLLPIREYEIRHGAVFSTATVLATTIDTQHDILECVDACLTTGSHTFWIVIINEAGAYGTENSTNFVVQAPGTPSISYDIIDNFVTLRWSVTPGTFAIRDYEVRRGNTFATAQVIGTVGGGFTTIFETVADTYKYWIRAKDHAENYGTENSIDVIMASPPDYVLNQIFSSYFSGTKTNCAIDIDNETLVYPINTSVTWASVIAAGGWTTPASAISSGYDYWVQPSEDSMLYSEIFDYGAVLGTSQITVGYTENVVDGIVSTYVDIFARATTTDAWVTVVTSSPTGVANSFRYVRADIHSVASAGDDLATMNNLVVRLDSRLINDSGSDSVSIPVSGASIVFNTAFADVNSIQVTPAGTSARFAVYDFNDIPNPTGFDVYLFDASGAYASGSFSWSARGY